MSEESASQPETGDEKHDEITELENVHNEEPPISQDEQTNDQQIEDNTEDNNLEKQYEDYKSESSSHSASQESNKVNKFEAEEEDLCSLDDLTDQQLIDIVTEKHTLYKYLTLENYVFETFLRKYDPTYEEPEIASIRDSSTEAGDRRYSRVRYGSSKISILDTKNINVSITQKTELIFREMEELQTELEKFSKKCKRQKSFLKADLEELSIRGSEIKEALDVFESDVVTKGFDELTQRIPAEVFVRFMHEWLKSAQFSIEKIRLRSSTHRAQYATLSNQLAIREQMGESIHPVDFEQLRMENKDCLATIDKKNSDLLEMKQMSGNVNLALTKQKQYVHKQTEEVEKLENYIVQYKKKYDEISNECKLVEAELLKVKQKYNRLNRLKNSYKVPEIKEYMDIKTQVYDLDKAIKIRKRRQNIQDIALTACITEMKNMTGSSTVKEEWFVYSSDSESEAF